MGVLLGALGLGERRAWIEVDDSEIEVRMGWAFHARFPRSSVNRVARSDRRPISQGVHGRNGRWLVNGATRGLVRVDLAPNQTARVLGRRVKLSTLEVSIDDPEALLTALSPATESGAPAVVHRPPS
jgi:hypothetical protein